MGKKVNLGGACMVYEAPCMLSLHMHDDFLNKMSLDYLNNHDCNWTYANSYANEVVLYAYTCVFFIQTLND